MTALLFQKTGPYETGSGNHLTPVQQKLLCRSFSAAYDDQSRVLGGRGGVGFVRIEGIGPVVIKSYKRGGLVRHLIRDRYARCGKTRPQLEYEMLETVRAIGVSAPEPVAFAVAGRLFYRGWLVTMEIPGHRSMADLSVACPEKIGPMMEALAHQVDLLVKNGIKHADLHPGNVLLDENGTLFLIDFDKAATCGEEKSRLKMYYAGRWNRAVKKYSLPEMLYMSV